MENNTLGFMAKQDWRNHDWSGFNRPNTVWFIEHDVTREWLTNEMEYTKDPNKAMWFYSELSALTYAIKNKVFNGHILTEHEFII